MENNWFISKEVIRHDLGGGAWIEYKKEVTYDEFISVFKDMKDGNEFENAKMAKPLLKIALVGWNLKDSDGEEVIFSKEKIDELSANAVLQMATPIMTAYHTEKKSVK